MEHPVFEFWVVRCLSSVLLPGCQSSFCAAYQHPTCDLPTCHFAAIWLSDWLFQDQYQSQHLESVNTDVLNNDVRYRNSDVCSSGVPRSSHTVLPLQGKVKIRMVFWECNPITSLKLIYYFHQAWGVWSMCMCVLVSEEPRYLGSPWCCNYRWIWTIYMGAGNPTQVPEITTCALNYSAIFSPCHLLLYVSVCSALLLVANVLLANFLIKPHHRCMYVCIGKEVIHIGLGTT